jgi:hypothetical protein
VALGEAAAVSLLTPRWRACRCFASISSDDLRVDLTTVASIGA